MLAACKIVKRRFIIVQLIGGNEPEAIKSVAEGFEEDPVRGVVARGWKRGGKLSQYTEMAVVNLRVIIACISKPRPLKVPGPYHHVIINSSCIARPRIADNAVILKVHENVRKLFSLKAVGLVINWLQALQLYLQRADLVFWKL